MNNAKLFQLMLITLIFSLFNLNYYQYIVIKNNYRLMYEPKSIVFHHHGIHHEMNIERAQSIINIIENSGCIE